MARLHGVEKIEVGPVGADGAPGTNLEEVTGLRLDSVNVTIPAIEGNPIYVEETESAFDELDDDQPDPVQVTFASYVADNETLHAIYGGTLSGGKYTPSRSGEIRTVIITTKAREGSQKRFVFPRVRLRPSIDQTLTKSDLTAVTATGTALTPYDGSGNALQDFYMEDVAVP